MDDSREETAGQAVTEDRRGVFQSRDGLWENLCDGRLAHTIIEPVRAPLGDVIATLRVLSGDGQPVLFKPGDSDKVGYICRFTEEGRDRRYTWCSLRSISFFADLPAGKIRHNYPEPETWRAWRVETQTRDKPLGPIFIVFVIYSYQAERHRLIISALAGGKEVRATWQKISQEIAYAYPETTVREKGLGFFDDAKPKDLLHTETRGLKIGTAERVNEFHRLVKSGFSHRQAKKRARCDPNTYYRRCVEVTGEEPIVPR